MKRDFAEMLNSKCFKSPDQEHCTHWDGKHSICCWCGKNEEERKKVSFPNHGEFDPEEKKNQIPSVSATTHRRLE